MIHFVTRKWVVGLVAMAMVLSAPASSWAVINPLDPNIVEGVIEDIFDNLENPTDLLPDLDLDDLNVGTLLSWGLFDFGDINWDCIGGGCGSPKLKNFQMQQKAGTKMVLPSSGSFIVNGTVSNGKMAVQMEKRFGIDTDRDDAAEHWSNWGARWAWLRKSKNQYFNAKYYLASSVVPATTTTSGKLTMSFNGQVVPNSGSQAPTSYSAPVINPGSWRILANIDHESHHKNVYGLWTNGRLVMWVTKRLRGKSIVRTSAWGSNGTYNFELGKVVARGTGAGTSHLYNHIMYKAYN